MLTSPSFNRMSCSMTRWLITGCVIPPMLTSLVCAETSTFNFMLTSRFGCTRGVRSIFTPTSWYVNCVFTSGLMPPAVPPAIPIPDEKLPVAMGMRSPIFNLAVWPSTERTSGFWIIFVLVSLRIALAVALGRVKITSFPFSERSWLRLIPPLFDVDVLLELLVVPLFGLITTLVVCGGRIPKSLNRSLRASSTSTCITTWLGFVDVADHLFRKHQLVRCIPHNDRVLRVELR